MIIIIMIIIIGVKYILLHLCSTNRMGPNVRFFKVRSELRQFLKWYNGLPIDRQTDTQTDRWINRNSQSQGYPLSCEFTFIGFFSKSFPKKYYLHRSSIPSLFSGTS